MWPETTAGTEVEVLAAAPWLLPADVLRESLAAGLLAESTPWTAGWLWTLLQEVALAPEILCPRLTAALLFLLGVADVEAALPLLVLLFLDGV